MGHSSVVYKMEKTRTIDHRRWEDGDTLLEFWRLSSKSQTIAQRINTPFVSSNFHTLGWSIVSKDNDVEKNKQALNFPWHSS